MKRRPDERGQMTPLIIGFGVILILLMVVVFDASQVFIYRRGLAAIADGAALAATNGIDDEAIYTGGVEDKVVLSQELAQVEVNNYMAHVADASITCVVAGIDVSEATVNCQGTAHLPIVNTISGQGALTVYATASAETFATTGP